MVRSFFFLGGGEGGGVARLNIWRQTIVFVGVILVFQIKKFFLIKSFDLFFAFVIVSIIYIICIYIIL